MRAADVYRALLWCYPAQFRHEYGGEMVGAFTAQLREARLHSGPLAVAGIWADTLIDLIPTALREHRHVMQQDLRYAIRMLAASPAFTVVAVSSLALGIGANTAIFSLLNSMVMSTLPVPNPHELAILTDPASRGLTVGWEEGDRTLASYNEFLQLQKQTTTFASLMASASSLSAVEARVAGGEPEEMTMRLVSASYFATLGVPALVGRTFDAPSEPAIGSAPYAVISHEYWQRRFGGRSDALGRAIALRDGVFAVIGVMPPSFFGETVGQRPDAWVPLAMQATVRPARDWLHDPAGSSDKVMWLHLFGRMRRGVSLERAQVDANVIFQQGLAAHYAAMGDAELRTRLLAQRLRLRNAATGASTLRASFAEPLLVLLGAAGLVLLIACANLGNLLLARTTARTREMTVRLALGASHGRLMRQLLTESLCLATLGGLAGVGAAVVFRKGLLRLVSDVSIPLPTALDVRTFGFIFAVTLAAGIVLGLLPALRATNAKAAGGLREHGRGIAGSAAWLRIGQLVVVGQLALSLPLLVGAGLLVRTLFNLQHFDLGYPRDGVLMVRVDAQAAAYDAARERAAFEELLARVRAVPGVRAAAFTNNAPFSGSFSDTRIAVEGYTPAGRDDRESNFNRISPGYFSTLGVQMAQGREITEQDRPGTSPVCVINETFARRFFNGRSPLGRRVTTVDENGRVGQTFEIVGVARDSRQTGLRGDIEHRFYVSATQLPVNIGTVTFLIRSHGDDSGVVADVRRVVREAQPSMPILRTGTLTAAINARIVEDRMLAQLSIAFGVVAVLLAAIGLYGVLSYGVARRTNEIGIRKALGAQHGALMTMILRETGWLLLVGLIAGSALSLAAIRLITSRLHGLSANDPATYTAAIAGLAIVAALATWLPAYRASRVDPLVALRCE